MIIVQVTNKVFVVFFSQKEILSDTNTFSISTSFTKKRSLSAVKFIYFNFNVSKH